MGNCQSDQDGRKVISQKIEVIQIGSDCGLIYCRNGRDGQKGSRDDLEEEWAKFGDWFVNAHARVEQCVGYGLEGHKTQGGTQDNFQISRLDNGVEDDAIYLPLKVEQISNGMNTEEH